MVLFTPVTVNAIQSFVAGTQFVLGALIVYYGYSFLTFETADDKKKRLKEEKEKKEKFAKWVKEKLNESKEVRETATVQAEAKEKSSEANEKDEREDLLLETVLEPAVELLRDHGPELNDDLLHDQGDDFADHRKKYLEVAKTLYKNARKVQRKIRAAKKGSLTHEAYTVASAHLSGANAALPKDLDTAMKTESSKRTAAQNNLIKAAQNFVGNANKAGDAEKQLSIIVKKINDARSIVTQEQTAAKKARVDAAQKAAALKTK